MLKKNHVAVLVYTMASVQVCGLATKVWQEGSQLALLMQFQNGMSPFWGRILSQGTVALLGLSILWAFFKWTPWPFLMLGTIFFSEAAAHGLLGVDPMARFSLGYTAISYIWLLAVGYALLLYRRIDSERPFPLVSQLCRWGLAVSVIFNAWQSIQHFPPFVTLLITISEYVPLRIIGERNASQLLNVFAAIQISCSLLILWKPWRSILLLMATCGLLTMLVQLDLPSPLGTYEALLRAPFVGIPLLIILLNPKRLVHKSRSLKSLFPIPRIRVPER